MIAATRHIGLCAYWPADIAEPYHVARVFATLDHLAGGAKKAAEKDRQREAQEMAEAAARREAEGEQGAAEGA